MKRPRRTASFTVASRLKGRRPSRALRTTAKGSKAGASCTRRCWFTRTVDLVLDRRVGEVAPAAVLPNTAPGGGSTEDEGAQGTPATFPNTWAVPAWQSGAIRGTSALPCIAGHKRPSSIDGGALGVPSAAPASCVAPVGALGHTRAVASTEVRTGRIGVAWPTPARGTPACALTA